MTHTILSSLSKRLAVDDVIGYLHAQLQSFASDDGSKSLQYGKKGSKQNAENASDSVSPLNASSIKYEYFISALLHVVFFVSSAVAISVAIIHFYDYIKSLPVFSDENEASRSPFRAQLDFFCRRRPLYLFLSCRIVFYVKEHTECFDRFCWR